MISHLSAKVNELLRMSKDAVVRYCKLEGLPSIQIEYSLELTSKKFAGFVYTARPVKIVLNANASDRLTNMSHKDRVWWLNNYIAHELTHYKQYLLLVRNKLVINEKSFDESEATSVGAMYADSVINKYTKEQINPTNLYKSFHGNNPKITKISYNPPKEGEHLISIGLVENLVYKPFGSSQRKGTLYTHQFGDDGEKMHPGRMILACSEDGERFYLIKANSKAHMTDRGIIK